MSADAEVSTPSTVLHRGYIAQELMRAQVTERYAAAARVILEWAHADPEQLLEPPERVLWARSEMQAMKLEAFERAGQIYRLALAEVDRVRELARFGIRIGTAIHYQDMPVGMTRIDFEQQEFPWVA